MAFRCYNLASQVDLIHFAID